MKKTILLLLWFAAISCKMIETSTVPQVTSEAAGVSLNYVTVWQKIYVNATKIQGANCTLTLMDSNNKLIYQNTSATHPPFFTTEINTSELASGNYTVILTTELETVTTTFVKP